MKKAEAFYKQLFQLPKSINFSLDNVITTDKERSNPIIDLEFSCEPLTCILWISRCSLETSLSFLDTSLRASLSSTSSCAILASFCLISSWKRHKQQLLIRPATVPSTPVMNCPLQLTETWWNRCHRHDTQLPLMSASEPSMACLNPVYEGFWSIEYIWPTGTNAGGFGGWCRLQKNRWRIASVCHYTTTTS